MSPRSRRSEKLQQQVRRAAKVKGAKAPSISARLATIEHFLRGDVKPLLDNARPVAGTPGTPPIKPRLEALIDRAIALKARLDQLSHTIVGDGNPTESSSGPKPLPFAIPDQLETLETLLLQCGERLEGISNRF